MKALVLSGGTGSRLRPFSHSMPKQLIPIANKPVLEHVLGNIRDIGVSDIGIIVGDRASSIQEAIGDGSRLDARITYLRQETPGGLGHCVALARDFLGDDDFVMYLGDNFLADGIAPVARTFVERRPAAHVIVHRVPDPRQFGIAELDDEGNVLRLVEKPRQPTSDLALVGVYFFTPAIHEAVASIRPSARGELEITDAIQWLHDAGARVTATEYDGYWKDVGHTEDVLACNRYQLNGLRRTIDGWADPSSELVGQVELGVGARVIRSRVEGPVVIGPGTLVEDSHVGPNTAIGADCVIRSTRLADSVVMDRAAILDIPGLRGSLIGRSATIRPRGTEHRLVVGDDVRIELAA
ncbi:glucose-1-phosphate thymidylyltransferase [Micromonospora sp. WMMD882]|uniref:glucose-1-phosphate thymidylyltransferase n=1 Tax=Micromonospora sp. WMMD882 TaxID=3015151 RepID=UPI00248A92BE|nr:glucose-1-phosphate thymidylyltransferase [Micromonospora sp. WMMD882]WBB78709.1 glucose-1-phosphate thymidylyltransferase [Micromonospora sp. WMMD882]